MKKMLTTASLLCLMVASMMTSASALEYTIDAPSEVEYAKATSVEVVYTADRGEQPNKNLSKDAALVPPGFGTPTSYLPDSGEYLTPNLVGSGLAASTSTIVSADGWNAPPSAPVGSGTSNMTVSTPAVGFTKVTSELYYSTGHLGTLSIPGLGVNVRVYEGTDSATLAKGAGHYIGTSLWDGNVVICGHNRGVNCYFGDIHTMSTGEEITLTTKLGTRTYKVVSVSKVKETDNSMLYPSNGNQVTLLTCVRNQSEYRWCVIAKEV